MPKPVATSSVTRNLTIAAASLVLAGAVATAGVHACRARLGGRGSNAIERRIEALDNLRATGAISDAEYDERVRRLSHDPQSSRCHAQPGRMLHSFSPVFP